MFTRIVAALAAGILLAGAPAASAANYAVEGSRLVISDKLYGDRDIDRFADVLRSHPEVKTIVMKNFYGGVHMSGFLNITKMINDHGLATEVDGPCISACALAFIGGVRRGAAPGADPKRTFVAFHGIYRAGRQSDTYRQTYVSAVRRYTGGRMSAKLAGDAYDLPQSGYVAFYDSRQMKRPDGSSVFMCTGKEKRKTADCPAVPAIDAYAAGVFTR